MLFAVLQSTEPFLDSYFEFAPLLPAYLQQNVHLTYLFLCFVCTYVCMNGLVAIGLSIGSGICGDGSPLRHRCFQRHAIILHMILFCILKSIHTLT